MANGNNNGKNILNVFARPESYPTVRHLSSMQRLFFVLCAFAVLGAQVFGVTRGFECDCGSMTRIVALDHCHGVHGEDCHEDESPIPHHHEEEDSDRRDHAEVKDDFNGLSHPAPHFIFAAPMVMAPIWEQVFPSPTVANALNDYLRVACSASPPRIAPSRTVIFLI